ncbi:hypothetical protein J6590_105883 [Homalodisca vitripennis]|nr:hypothetical protein J6590_105883 [Homalodisca vitripennis]
MINRHFREMLLANEIIHPVFSSGDFTAGDLALVGFFDGSHLGSGSGGIAQNNQRLRNLADYGKWRMSVERVALLVRRLEVGTEVLTVRLDAALSRLYREPPRQGRSLPPPATR